MSTKVTIGLISSDSKRVNKEIKFCDEFIVHGDLDNVLQPNRTTSHIYLVNKKNKEHGYEGLDLIRGVRTQIYHGGIVTHTPMAQIAIDTQDITKYHNCNHVASNHYKELLVTTYFKLPPKLEPSFSAQYHQGRMAGFVTMSSPSHYPSGKCPTESIIHQKILSLSNFQNLKP